MESENKKLKKITLPYEKSDWKKITEILSRTANFEYKNFTEIIESFGEFNSNFKNSFLLNYFEEELDQTEKEFYVNELFPFIAKIAIDTKIIFTDTIIHQLGQFINQKISLSRLQALNLNIHLFLGTIGESYQELHGLSRHCNFNQLLVRRNPVIIHLLNYFKRVYQEHDVLKDRYIDYIFLGKESNDKTIKQQAWEDSEAPLVEIFFDNKKIEDTDDAIHVDFADPFIGGLIRSSVCTQEEILFMNSPEVIPSMLFTKKIKDLNAVLIVGAERYTEYTGFNYNYKYLGNYVETRRVFCKNSEEKTLKDNYMLAIDAIPMAGVKDKEKSAELLLREMNKAFIGMDFEDYTIIDENNNKNKINNRKGLSTGKWGCGEFYGDIDVKFCVQWMACSRARRNMHFHIFHSKDAEHLPRFQKEILDKGIGTVGKLFRAILDKTICK